MNNNVPDVPADIAALLHLAGRPRALELALNELRQRITAAAGAGHGDDHHLLTSLIDLLQAAGLTGYSTRQCDSAGRAWAERLAEDCASAAAAWCRLLTAAAQTVGDLFAAGVADPRLVILRREELGDAEAIGVGVTAAGEPILAYEIDTLPEGHSLLAAIPRENLYQVDCHGRTRAVVVVGVAAPFWGIAQVLTREYRRPQLAEQAERRRREEQARCDAEDHRRQADPMSYQLHRLTERLDALAAGQADAGELAALRAEAARMREQTAT